MRYAYFPSSAASLLDKLTRATTNTIELGGEAASIVLDGSGTVAIHTTCYEHVTKVLGLKAYNGVIVDIADEEEANACRSLNAPFVFRVKTERAYCVVLTSVDETGSICDPLCHSSAQLVGLHAEEQELSAVLHQVAPEINAVLLTSSQFLSAHSTTLTSLPPHITIAITVSCFNEEMAAEVLQVR